MLHGKELGYSLLNVKFGKEQDNEKLLAKSIAVSQTTYNVCEGAR